MCPLSFHEERGLRGEVNMEVFFITFVKINPL